MIAAHQLSARPSIDAAARSVGIFQEREQEALVRLHETARCRVMVNVMSHGRIRLHDLLRLRLIGVHLVGRRAFLRDHHAADEAAVADRQERLWARRRTGRPCRPGRSTQIDRRNPAMPQEEPERAAVDAEHAVLDAADDALDPGLLRALARARRAGATHISGVSVSETMPLAKIETTIVIANSRKMRPISPLMNTSGRNTAASEIVIDRIVKLISLALFERRVERRFVALLHPADGVLQEHDRVVHQEPDRQRQRHQREVVQAVAQQLHRDERQQQRQRQRDGGNQRVGGAAEEDEDHQHDQHERDEQRLLHVVDAVHDGQRAVVDRHDQHRTAEAAAESSGSMSRTALATSTAFAPAWRKTATTTVAVGTVVAAHPEAHVDALVLHAVAWPSATSFR